MTSPRVEAIRLSSEPPLLLLAHGGGTLYFDDPDEHRVFAFDAATLRVRWSTGATLGYSAWERSGQAFFVAGDDLFTVEDEHLVRRAGATGQITTRTPFAGQLVGAHVVDDRRVLIGRHRAGAAGLEISLIDLAGAVAWSIPRDEPAQSPRRYDARDEYRCGDAILHPELGLGIVQRIVERNMIVAFACGGRRVACAGGPREARAPEVVRAQGSPSRRYLHATACGAWALVGYVDGRSGDVTVKGFEGLELRELATGAEHLASAPSEVECASTDRHDRAIRRTDHALRASDARGAILDAMDSALYELDGTSGHLRWSLPADHESPLEVALTEQLVLAIFRDARDGGSSLDALDRGTGRRLWRVPLPPALREPGLVLAGTTAVVAWADRDLHVVGVALDGAVRFRLDPVRGMTAPARSGERPHVRLVAIDRAVLAFASSDPSRAVRIEVA